ncbi:DHH family phosphoesterase [Mesomycoplasma conjunctivae]|uniref:DHH family phosphoesterase n=1 Tax=Mesomycoplasma conjunctivae TaxID=45361 RepID=UPI003DA291C2
MKIGNNKDVVEIIKQYQKIVIFHHIRPDGDCLGSQSGLKQLILDNFQDKTVYAVGDTKNSYWFMNIELDNFASPEELDGALAIIVDANFKERIEFSYLFEKVKFAKIIRIDHHPNDDDLGEAYRWVDSSFIACAEQISQLAIDNNLAISKRTAEFLYLGIYTDSGRFLYANTTARTHFLAAKLMETGFDFQRIHTHLNSKKISDLEFENYIFLHKKIYQNVIYYTLDLDEQKKLHKNPAQATRPNILANIDNFYIWVSLVQEEAKKWRVEFRSSGPNVRNVALKWGGGGHLQASGTILDSLDKIDSLIKDCQLECDLFIEAKNKTN